MLALGGSLSFSVRDLVFLTGSTSGSASFSLDICLSLARLALVVPFAAPILVVINVFGLPVFSFPHFGGSFFHRFVEALVFFVRILHLPLQGIVGTTSKLEVVVSVRIVRNTAALFIVDRIFLPLGLALVALLLDVHLLLYLSPVDKVEVVGRGDAMLDVFLVVWGFELGFEPSNQLFD